MISLVCGDALHIPLADGTVQCVITSPPYYGLRDYNVSGQIGLEQTPEEYIAKMVQVFREVWRVLRDDGTVWINLGDSYNSAASNQNGGGLDGTTRGGNKERGRNNQIWAGLKPKDLLGIPWRVAFALQADGWYLRSEIIWHKPNPMPESVTDRPTKSHEQVFLLSKRQRYYYDAEAIKEQGTGTEYDLTKRESGRMEGRPSMEARGYKSQGESFGKGQATRNRRTVWTIATSPYSGAHFATFPPALVEPCLLAGTSERGCCPKCGKAWVRVVEKGDIIMPQDNRPGRNYKYKQVSQDEIDYGNSKGGNGKAFAFGTHEKISTGWRASCSCPPAEPVPCLCLDPFAGTFTVGMVAAKYRRNAVGIELNPQYIELAKRRCSEIQVVMLP